MVPRFTAKFIIRKDRCPNSDVKPIHAKCYFFKQKVVLSTGLMVHLNNWNAEKQICIYSRKGNLSKQQVDETNLLLAGIMNKVQAIYFEYRLGHKHLDIDTFKEKYGSAGASRSFHDFFAEQMNIYGNIFAKNTIRQYRVNQNLLKEFMPTIDVNQLTPELVKKWDGFLRRRYSNANSRMKHHRMAKRFMLLACKQFNILNPYDGFKVRHINGKREYLNKFEVQALVELSRTDKLNDEELLALKKYLFSCHVGGLRISDIHSIGIDDVFDTVLVLVPQKTSGQAKRVQIPMNKNALGFAQHLTGPTFFDFQTDQFINRCLKVAAELTGLKKWTDWNCTKEKAPLFLAGHSNQ